MTLSPPSPAGETSPFPSRFELTPNSKVKALLASLENGSDEDDDSGSARARLVSAFRRSTSKKAASNANDALLEKSSRDISATVELNQSEDDEEDHVLRPKGRMAARMLEAESDSDNSDRLEGTILRRTTKTAPIGSTSGSPTADDSSTNNGFMIPRKRKIRVPRPSTPQLNPKSDFASPGLFVSPPPRRSATPAGTASDSDELPGNILANDRFKALVEKKRQERLAKEKEAAVEKAKRLAEQEHQNDMLHEDEDISDGNVERRLTQQAKPTRKASKRAQEEISRETQRMSRNMQLTHKAITKKKITKASLFAKFNYKTTSLAGKDLVEHSRPTSSSSAGPHSDMEMRETPPTSPAPHHSDIGKPARSIDESTTLAELGEKEENGLVDLEDVLSRLHPPPIKILDKGIGEAVEDSAPEAPTMSLFQQRPIRVRTPKMFSRKATGLDDSDSDLEITSAKTPDVKSKKLDSIFDRVPAKQAKESSSLYALRMLAHITSPGKQNGSKDKKQSMTTSEMQLSLQQRARQQATREREERLQSLRDKGIIVQTTEEREKELAEVEDLVSKARQEGEEIMKREKAAAKKERKANGDVDPLESSSDDEDWEEEEENHKEQLSDSDEEGDDSENDAEDEEEIEEENEENKLELDETEIAEASTSNQMLENEASESGDEEAEAELSSDEEMAEPDDDRVEDEEEELPAQQRRRWRKANIISDDEDEKNQVQETPVASRTKPINEVHTDSPAPNSVLRSATKTFIPGLSVAGPAGLGLTQIFAGTMDESQDTSPTAPNTPQYEVGHNDAMAFLRARPVPELPHFVPTMSDDSQDFVMDSQSGHNRVSGSQTEDSQTQNIHLQFSQSQIHGFDSLVLDPMSTQFSEIPEATQDAGFQHMTPIRGRFEAPPSTVDTVVLGSTMEPEHVEETPIVKKKGRLHRRAPQVPLLSDDEDAVEHDETKTEAEDLDITANVFDVMRKASKKPIVVDEFHKKTSGAKEMVDEQADESEDEYAGLGGASDDESGGEEDAYVKEIIDDEGGKDVDEHKLAAFFADRERASDEKQVEKLYNDITKGMLRRKRGADYDLSDSDDDGEARRRMKRKEFAKMRKALLADERIGKIAENPKRQAFLRAIEDRGSDDEMGFIDDFELDETRDSQSQSQTEEPRVPDSQPEMMGPPKRKRPGEATKAEQRLPPHLRRTKATQKPSSLDEIRESVSSLIEEPNAVIQQTESGSESEDELEIEGEPKDKENRDPFALRRTNVATIDRIALKRASSSSLSTSTRLAFTASSSTPGFKVPPLLRRATTNNSIASASSSNSSFSGGVSGMERLAGGSGNGAVKRGGGKNSGVNYFARESERRAAIVKTEKRIEQKRSKGAETRRKAVGGLFGGGKFE
ncbi:DNA replication checkpoint mediator mrc1 [Hyphodiscus hymeniophilus]|uniref:DNA replication checkpoint mediator mrc1 n=1 Tax=Hyphodiscus hymeniophilus TaxID=353542 RepID=A0A9P6VP77_9HELO|nr:DNA replication checkpoint mediator mrc1 [Hyphodiscus hymeniophilus]